VSRIAVIGGGIAGLGVAWLLARRHHVQLFEREARLGGHTHTHQLDTPDGPLAVDTGFIVHNDRTYPLLVQLFDELKVDRLDTDMSFGVVDPATGFEYSTRNLSGLFADRRTLASPAHYAFLLNLLRFNRTARQALTDPGAEAWTLGEFCARHGFAGRIVSHYIQPLACAIWSASTATIADFPFVTLARFFEHHGMLNTLDHPTWKVLRGGSSTYIPKLLASAAFETHVSAAPTAVRRTATGVELRFADRPALEVDEVVMACHGDQILPMLADPTPTERAVLSAFTTTANHAVLHTDASYLPTRAAARAAWNYTLGPSAAGATLTYDMTRLQRLETRAQYCVTLNPARPIARSCVLAEIDYTHPLYTREAIRAQARWGEVSGQHRIHYCGAYWFYGFHEDGYRSAVRVAEALGVTWPEHPRST
jgi:predicted NAD/FAD-binding protein